MRPAGWLCTGVMGALALSSLGAKGTPKATPFETAMAASKSNLESPEGQRYDEQFGRWFGEHHGDTMVRCTKGAKPDDLRKFDLLVRVSGEGKAEEVLVSPQTSVARCVAEEIRKGASVQPPRPSYWVRVEMTISP